MTALKNFWKRFTVWGTEFGVSVPDIFASAKFRIALLYFLANAIILIIASIVVDIYIGKFIHKELFSLFGSEPAIDATTARILENMKPEIWATRVIKLLIMAPAAYFLAGITLRPIQKALESQSRFVANASHELRTPLTIMKTNSDIVLSDPDLTKEKAVETIKDNLEEIDRMTSTLQVLLSFSGYENRVSKLMFSKIDLSKTTERVTKLIKLAADKKNIKLELNIAPIAMIHGNAAAIEELTFNLIKNAVSYTPKNGKIVIELLSHNHTISLTIKNFGVIISSEDLLHIFEPFYRGTNITGLKKNGAGLGLAIAHEIAKIHNAKISVESSPENGTIFSTHFRPV